MPTVHPIQLFFSSSHPLASKVDADFEGSVGGLVKIKIAASADFVHDARGSRLHTGFATIVLDSMMGGAVMGSLEKLQPIATIGLSVHHLRRPDAGEMISGYSKCTDIYNDIAYVTGALNGEDGTPIAVASGTFMIGTRGTSIRQKSDTNGKVESRI